MLTSAIAAICNGSGMTTPGKSVEIGARRASDRAYAAIRRMTRLELIPGDDPRPGVQETDGRRPAGEIETGDTRRSAGDDPAVAQHE